MITQRKLLIGLMALSSVGTLTLSDASGTEDTPPLSANASFFKRHKGACLAVGLFVGTLALYYTRKKLHEWYEENSQTPKDPQNNITEIIPDPHDHTADTQDPQNYIFGNPQAQQLQNQNDGLDNFDIPFGTPPENQDGQTINDATPPHGNLYKTARELASLDIFGDENFSDDGKNNEENQNVDEENQNVDMNPPADPIDQVKPQQNDLVQVETMDGKTVITIATDSNELPDDFEMPGQLEVEDAGVDTLVINLKSIDNQFSEINCKKLVLGEAVETIEREAFMNSSIKEVDMTACKNLKTIQGSAFANTAITSIRIPESITTIRSQAFRNCTNLQTVIIPASFDPLSKNNKKSADVFTEIPGITIQAPAGQKLHANWAKAGKFIGNNLAILDSEIDGGTK